MQSAPTEPVEAAVTDTGVNPIAIAGGLEPLWNAWLTGNAAALQHFRTYAELQQAAITMLRQLPAPHGRRGLLLATTKGDLDAQVQWMRAFDAQDAVLAPPLPPGLGSEAALFANEAQAAGPVYVVSTACSSGLAALIEAAMLLLDREADEMVVLAIDHAGDFVRDGFHALKAVAPYACRPFDRRRDGLALGSAAAACLLSPRSGAPLLINGGGIASDGVHMTAPDRDARGLIAAIRQALAAATLLPEDIDVIVAHGTATRYNDAMEATAFRSVFGSCPRPPAITAVKGLIGHTLGASGLVEALLAANILFHQVIPPIVGLEEPEWDDLDFVRESRRPDKPLRYLLKVASGFGGLNAAVVLSLPTPAGGAA
jgi:3-oxoacyl-[acyl-carrier-protein] synthase II